MKNLSLNSKGILFGIIGSLVGIFPNAVLKNFLHESHIAGSCLELPFFAIGRYEDILITPCGIFTVIPLGLFYIPFVLPAMFMTLMVIILGGALFGFIGMKIGYNKAEKNGYNLGKENWRGSFWWSFVGGILFDLIFIFTVFYP